jgi:hypothetical protein
MGAHVGYMLKLPSRDEDGASKRSHILFLCLIVHVYQRKLNSCYSMIHSTTCWRVVGKNKKFHLFSNVELGGCGWSVMRTSHLTPSFIPLLREIDEAYSRLTQRDFKTLQYPNHLKI